jgi:hypothetical protein
MNERVIAPYYERRAPSAQNVADIFGGTWKSALPGIVSGDAPMFGDSRPAWIASQLPGGFTGRSVLELGPFEGYQTYHVLAQGARRVVAVEANSINFLKCLCVKELYDLTRASFVFGDALSYLEGSDEPFDVVVASGILYHLQDPIRFIERLAAAAPAVYVWTHYFDAPVMAQLRNGQERHFLPEENVVRRYGDGPVTLHARSYLLPDYRNGIPMYWEGGLEQISYWLTKDDIFAAFRRAGMRVAAVEFENTELNGLPAIGFLAVKEETQPLPGGARG